MARAATHKTAPAAAPAILPAAELILVEAHRADVQAEQAARAIAQHLGYQLPADSADPDLIQRDIAANMRRSVEACLEVGRGLRVLKEACVHGEFTARLDVLGIDKHVAARFMQSATKFSKLPSTATLKAIGNQTKLFEMLVLDDEQLEELELTGQTGELRLDEVATMSVKELRAALREARADAEANKELLDKKNQRIDKLERDRQRIARLPADAALAETQNEAAAILADALGAIRGNLRHALIALANAGDERGANTVFMAGLVGQLAAELALLREEFDLPDVSNAADLKLAAEVAQWGNP